MSAMMWAHVSDWEGSTQEQLSVFSVLSTVGDKPLRKTKSNNNNNKTEHGDGQMAQSHPVPSVVNFLSLLFWQN